VKNAGERAILLGAGFVALIIAALTWFLGVSPKLSAASEARSATEAQNQTNESLRELRDSLVAESELMPVYTKEIIEAREYLPPEQDVVGVRRFLAAAASATGVTIVSDSVNDPQSIASGLSLEPAMSQVGLTSEIEGLSVPSLIGTSYGLVISGSYPAILAFIDYIQNSEDRYYLVTEFALSGSVGENEGVSSMQATLEVVAFTLDYGNPAIVTPPAERPWPSLDQNEGSPTTPSDRNPFR
jgi:hypothetical protein